MNEHRLGKYDILCIDIHSQLNDITLMIDWNGRQDGWLKIKRCMTSRL